MFFGGTEGLPCRRGQLLGLTKGGQKINPSPFSLFPHSAPLAGLITHAIRQVGANRDHFDGNGGVAAEAPRHRSPIIHQIVDRAFANQLAVAIIVQAKKGRNLPANKPLLLLWLIRGRLGVKEAGQ